MKTRVLKVISHVLNVPCESLDENSSFDSVKNWDSLRHMNVILALEEEFGVHFAAGDIVNMLSVVQILDTLKTRSHGGDVVREDPP